MQIFLIHIWLISNGVTSVCFAVDNDCKTLLSRGSGITVYGQSLSAFEWLCELFRWNSVTAVDNNRKRLTFYFPDTLYFSIDRYSFPFFVTWKSRSNFPFQWMTSGLATITIFRPDFTACFRFWKSAKLISATESSFHSHNKSSQNMQRNFKGFQKRLSRRTKLQLSRKIKVISAFLWAIVYRDKMNTENLSQRKHQFYVKSLSPDNSKLLWWEVSELVCGRGKVVCKSEENFWLNCSCIGNCGI